MHDEYERTHIQELQNCTLVTTGAWRSSNGAACGGVGTLVSKSAEIRSVNKRILVVMFSGNAMTTIIVNYAPTEGSDDAGAHYETLSSTVNATLKHHVVIECGNFNANFGSDKVRHTYHNTTNENGKLLLEHATECNLHVTNTMFKKWKGKFWTFISDMN